MSSNTCSICLDCLTTSGVGAAIPCGHIYHVECWRGWASRSNRNAKCPLCNVPSSGFCKIHIDVGAVIETAKGMQDDELDALSLTSSDIEGEDGDLTTDKSGEDDKNNKPSTNKCKIEIIDLVEGNSDASKLSCEISMKSKTRKYKRMAKRCRSRIRENQPRIEEKEQELLVLAKKKGDLETELHRLHGEINEMNNEKHRVDLNLMGLQYKSKQIQRSKDTMTRQHKETQQANEKIQRNLQQTVDAKIAELKKERAVGMNQVDEIASELTSLRNKNQKLKCELAKMKQLLGPPRTVSTGHRTTANPTHHKRGSKLIASGLKEMAVAVERHEAAKTNDPKMTAGSSSSSFAKGSAHAARMVGAVATKPRPLQPSLALVDPVPKRLSSQSAGIENRRRDMERNLSRPRKKQQTLSFHVKK